MAMTKVPTAVNASGHSRTDQHRSVTWFNDRERPRHREFASRRLPENAVQQPMQQPRRPPAPVGTVRRPLTCVNDP